LRKNEKAQHGVLDENLVFFFQHKEATLLIPPTGQDEVCLFAAKLKKTSKNY
jgi:hypothetical protein